MILAAISRIKSKSVSRDRKCQGGDGLLGCDALIRRCHRRTVSFMSSVAFRAGKKQDDHIQFTMLRGRRERVSSCDSVLEGRKHPQTFLPELPFIPHCWKQSLEKGIVFFLHQLAYSCNLQWHHLS